MAITLAYILDLILGDPRWLPHPVRGMGWLAKKLELPLRRAVKSERNAGLIFSAIIISIVWGLTSIIIWQTTSFNRYLGLGFSILFIYTALSIKDLKVESMRVCQALEEGDIITARQNLSLIVGRDTQNMDEKDIIRATVETIAENTADGIISPLFYAFIGGAPLALTYKAVNTLDSIVGYKNERYRYFGWASAKLDDLVNFIPARLSTLFLPLASWLIGKDGLSSWKISWRDGTKNPSPNSGFPEAAVAGALGIRLGGLNFYNSIASLKPFIGDNINPLETRHIKESIKIAYNCSALVLITGVVLTWAITEKW